MPSPQRTPPHFHLNQGLLPVVVWFIVALIASTLAGMGAYRYQRITLYKQAKAELSYLAQSQRDHLELWLKEQIKDAEITAKDPYLNEKVLERIKGSGASVAVLQERLQTIQNGYGYDAVRLLDSHIQTLLSTDADPLPQEDLRAAVALLGGAAPRLTWSLNGMGTDAVVKVSYLVPLRPGPDGKPLGILDFHLDFQSILVSIRHDQPTFRASGETLLVCEVEGQMVFLSRTRLTTAPIFGEALTGKEQEEIQAYLSGAGSSDWVDYRGVPCIAAFRQLSTLPWTIFSKMDREEITVHLVRLAWADTAVDALFILIAGLLSYNWWRQKQTQQKADWEHVQRERDHLDQQLKTLSRYANDIVLRLDGNGKVLDANDRALAAYGYSHDEMFGLYIKDLMTVQALRDFFKRFQAEEYLDSIRFETTQVRKDGSSFPVEMSSRQFKQNGARYFQVIIRDITERKQAEEALRRSEAKFRGVVSQPLVGIAIIEDGRFNYTNPRFAEIFGHSHEEIRLMTMLDLTTETDRPLVAEQIRKRVSGEVEQVEYEFLGLRKDGSPVHLEASGCTLELDGKLLLISMVRDISERKVAEAKVLALQDLLREQATRDGLTGLYNRRFLDEAMERELVLARRNDEEVSVIMGDLDHFKVVNDQYGHLAGDEALRVFSAMIQQLSRKSDIYCRYGGEEFLLVLPGMAKGIAVERAELLRRQIEAAPIRFGDFAIPVTASFGVACFPKDGSSRTELIAAADSALYLAKADGRNQVRT